MNVLVGVVLAIVGASAFSFGGVYDWTWWPTIAASLLAGAAGAWSRPSRIPRGVVCAALLVLAAGAVQLVPVSRTAILTFSPAADVFLARYDLAYKSAVASGQARHGFSIDPPKTISALIGFAGCITLMVGVAAAFTREMVGRTIRGLLVIGLALSMIGLMQRALSPAKIYGWRTLPVGANPFGPFINKNHFAGWMLMTVPLAIGYLFGRAERASRTPRGPRRSSVAWFASVEANQLVLFGVAVIVMGISLVLTMSRSGMSGFAGAVVVAALFVARAASSPASKRSMIAFLVAVSLVSVGWVGVDVVTRRFSSDNGTLGGRLPVWLDAVRIGEAFPLTGIGLNTYGTATLYYQTADLERHYVQAHNDYLQLLVEGGLLVAAPAFLALAVLAATVRRRFRETPVASTDFWIRTGAICGMIAIAVQEFADFSLQIPANAVLFAVIAGIALRPADPIPAVAVPPTP